jgi:hypothetical protein
MERDQRQPLCSSPANSAGTTGRALVSWRARLCALAGAIAYCGVAGPGVARAADSLGIDELTNQAETLVYSEINAPIPAQNGGAVGIAATAIAASIPSAPAAPTPAEDAIIPPVVEAAVPPAAAPLLTMGSSSTEGPPAAPPVTALPRGQPGEQPRAAKVPGRAGRPRAAVRTPTGLTIPSRALERNVLAANGGASGGRTVLGAGSTAQGRSPSRARREAPAGVRQPQPLPPVPLPPRPDASPAGQVVGQGLLLPLMLAALAAALAGFAFEFLPRALPRSAFRKPRRIALQLWHPG